MDAIPQEAMQAARCAADVASRRVPPQFSVDDLRAVALTAAWEASRRWRAGRGCTLRSFAAFVAKMRIRDLLREAPFTGFKWNRAQRKAVLLTQSMTPSGRRGSRAELDDEDDECEWWGGVEDPGLRRLEARDALRPLLRRLSKPQRLAVRLRWTRGWRGVEIAARLGVTPSRVSQLLREAMKLMRGRA